MKKTFIKKLKKSVSAILATAMSLSLFTAIPVSADIGRTTYNYDGYSVDYNVTNEWDGAQTVELTVSNTGTDSILNWALKYDAEGKISNLWNADLYEQNGDEYVIKNVGWNFEIAPSQSITYGYTLSGNDIALPDSFEIYSKRVDKNEGYDVQYNITKSWDVGVEGNIIITNTSSEPIEAWTLSFDSNFTIDNLWDGRVLENNGTSYIIAAEMWTNPVQPNRTITIGFVGSKTVDVEALLSNFRLTEVIIGEGMPVIPIDPPVEEIEITANAVYDEKNGNISVSWTSNKQDGTFDILMSEDGENFVSVGTVENVTKFVYTPENDFETLYFKVVQTVGELTAESNAVAVAKSSEDIAISAEADYDKETGKITVSWTSNKENGVFEVLVSEDGEDFSTVGTMEDVAEFVYSPENDFEILYFKVIQTIDEQSAESNLLIVLKTGVEIDWNDETDTDNDGIPDVYENYYFATDPENPDTDGDGLIDGFEVYIGTSPLNPDSNGNGILDGDEDSDNDGLSDLREYNLGTDPLEADTDRDGLSDNDEVNIHGTDPLKYDTDEDGISDGDEILLGLNPNNSSDKNSIVEQTLNSDNDVFDEINNDNEIYKLSVIINSSGAADKNLFVTESSYTNTINNNSIVGKVAELRYNEDFDVEKAKICFDISEIFIHSNAYDAEFSGIDQYFIFKYFEDINMLVPINTYYEGNTIYTEVDDLGVYCVINLNTWMSLFRESSSMYSLKSKKVGTNITDGNTLTAIGGSDNEENYITFDSSELTYSEQSSKVKMKTTANYNLSSDTRTCGNDLIFFPTPNDRLFELPEFILRNSKTAFSENKNQRIYVINYDGSLIKTSSGKEYATKYSQVKQMVAKLDPKNVEYDYSAIRETYYSIPIRSLDNIPNFDTSYDFIRYYGWCVNLPFGYVDVCFICNSLPYNSQVTDVKSYISTNMLNFFINMEGVRLYIINYDGSLLTTADGKIYAENSSEMSQMLTKITTSNSSMNLNAINTTYFNVCSESKLGYFYIPTSGIENFSTHGFYQGYCVPAEKDTRIVYSMDDFSIITLDDPITKDYLDAYNGIVNENDKLDYADTDGEGYYDFEEIDFSMKKINGEPMISWKDGKIMYPTFADVIDLKSSVSSYSSSNSLNKIHTFAESIYVLPQSTNVVKTDVDGDGIPDNCDFLPNSAARVSISGDYGNVYTIKNSDQFGKTLHYDVERDNIYWDTDYSDDNQNWKVIQVDADGKAYNGDTLIKYYKFFSKEQLKKSRFDGMLVYRDDSLLLNEQNEISLDNIDYFLSYSSSELWLDNYDDLWILSNVSNVLDERQYVLYNVNLGGILAMKDGKYCIITLPSNRESMSQEINEHIFWYFDDAFKLGVDFDRLYRNDDYIWEWTAKIQDLNSVKFSYSDTANMNLEEKCYNSINSWWNLIGLEYTQTDFSDAKTNIKIKYSPNLLSNLLHKYGSTGHDINEVEYILHDLNCTCLTCKSSISENCIICLNNGCKVGYVDTSNINNHSVLEYFKNMGFKVSDVIYRKDNYIEISIFTAEYTQSSITHEIGHTLGLCDRQTGQATDLNTNVSSIMNYKYESEMTDDFWYPQELDIYAVKFYYSDNYQLTFDYNRAK